MDIILWVGWFVCGYIAALIYYKNYRTEKDTKSDIVTNELLLFVWGYISLFTLFWMWLWIKINKKQ